MSLLPRQKPIGQTFAASVVRKTPAVANPQLLYHAEKEQTTRGASPYFPMVLSCLIGHRLKVAKN